MARPTPPAALIALLSLATVAGPRAAAAQRPAFAAPSLRLEAGAALPVTEYVKDANGAKVTGGLAPLFGVAAVFAVGRNSSIDLGARISRGPVTVEASGTTLDADPVSHADLVAGISLRSSPRLTLRAGGGLSHVTGDDRVLPFRDGNDAPWRPSGEIGASWNISVTRPLSLSLTAQGTRMGETSGSDPVRSAGTVMRLMAAVRYGR